MQLIATTISIDELKPLAHKMFGDLVKAVVDVQKKALVLDCELHSDAEQFLIERGSSQQALWGINLHPEAFGTDLFVEFDSMINIRPGQDNPSRDVLNEQIRQQIIEIVNTKITD